MICMVYGAAFGPAYYYIQWCKKISQFFWYNRHWWNSVKGSMEKHGIGMEFCCHSGVRTLLSSIFITITFIGTHSSDSVCCYTPSWLDTEGQSTQYPLQPDQKTWQRTEVGRLTTLYDVMSEILERLKPEKGINFILLQKHLSWSPSFHQDYRIFGQHSISSFTANYFRLGTSVRYMNSISNIENNKILCTLFFNHRNKLLKFPVAVYRFMALQDSHR